MSRPEVGEVRSKTLLRRMDFGRRGVEYTINLYRGCTHACVYCYAPSLVHDEREWGTFVDAKVDAPAILRRELRDAERAPVFLSSASDPYQPVEARYKLTRRCLQELHAFGFPVVVLTRSPLVLRDLDLLRRMEWVRVGCSISTAAGRAFEPGVPPVERRLETLRRLAEEGIETWVSLAPVIPGIVTFEIEELLSKLRDAHVGAVDGRIAPVPRLRRLQGDVRGSHGDDGGRGARVGGKRDRPGKGGRLAGRVQRPRRALQMGAPEGAEPGPVRRP